MTSSPIDAYLARLHQDWLADASGAVADLPASVRGQFRAAGTVVSQRCEA